MSTFSNNNFSKKDTFVTGHVGFMHRYHNHPHQQMNLTFGPYGRHLVKVNAARRLHAFAAPEHVEVYSGAVAPLLRPTGHDSEIHGPGGLGGVEGLPSADSEAVRARIDDGLPAVESMAAAIGRTWNAGEGVNQGHGRGDGAVDECRFAVERIVFMYGGIGVGNRSAVAGKVSDVGIDIYGMRQDSTSYAIVRASHLFFFLLCLPIALIREMILNATVPKTMIPLNVTHKAIVTDSIHNNPTSHEAHPGVASSPLWQTPSVLIQFDHFDFMDGPPFMMH
ncbi:hypothetical protein F5148DRAFT_1147452 [Russula earlei]|uniref:Uncharacterized protein n=1 Tax=Russula earlei TaxID=71964 RepID=A0ACC0UHR4_9AGAM|nr:hypothetical protein F5148DRAFT_1147452 [Russula earlei]